MVTGDCYCGPFAVVGLEGFQSPGYCVGQAEPSCIADHIRSRPWFKRTSLTGWLTDVVGYTSPDNTKPLSLLK